MISIHRLIMIICLALLTITVIVEGLNPSIIGKPYWHPIPINWWILHNSLFAPSIPTLIAFSLLIFGMLMPEVEAWGWHRTILMTAVIFFLIDLITMFMYNGYNIWIWPSYNWWRSIGVYAAPRLPTLLAIIVLLVGSVIPERISIAYFPKRNR